MKRISWDDVKQKIKNNKEVMELITAASGIASVWFDINPPKQVQESDWEEMANAGDAKSQLKLAEYYCDIGEFSKAIYLYKVLLDSGCWNVEYRCIAYNNLGWLYAHGYGVSDEAMTKKERLNYALTLFQKASEFGEGNGNIKTTRRNEYILLLTFDGEIFDDYNLKFAEAKKELSRYCIKGEMDFVPERRIKSKTLICKENEIPEGWVDANTYIVLTSPSSKDGVFPFVYTRIIYEEGTEELPELELIKLPTEESTDYFDYNWWEKCGL